MGNSISKSFRPFQKVSCLLLILLTLILLKIYYVCYNVISVTFCLQTVLRKDTCERIFLVSNIVLFRLAVAAENSIMSAVSTNTTRTFFIFDDLGIICIVQHGSSFNVVQFSTAGGTDVVPVSTAKTHIISSLSHTHCHPIHLRELTATKLKGVCVNKAFAIVTKLFGIVTFKIHTGILSFLVPVLPPVILMDSLKDFSNFSLKLTAN